MTEHMCKTLTDGCYRCDLNRDEIEAVIAEDKADAQTAWLDYRNAYAMASYLRPRQIASRLRRREFIAGFLAGRSS